MGRRERALREAADRLSHDGPRARCARSDVGALASRKDRTITVLVWNYHDDDLPAPAANVSLSIAGVGAPRVLVNHYRVDGEHSNSYEVWKKMGSPQGPTPEQYAQLERAGQLQLLGSPEWRAAAEGRLPMQFMLPRQGVSLLTITW